MFIYKSNKKLFTNWEFFDIDEVIDQLRKQKQLVPSSVYYGMQDKSVFQGLYPTGHPLVLCYLTDLGM